MLGRMLFRYGASTQRIVDSMECLHGKLGGGQLEVLVTYDAITVTALENGRTCTRIDASRELPGVNIRGQALIRRFLLGKETHLAGPAAYREKLREIASAPEFAAAFPWKWLAAAGASAGFCAFNGGDAAAMVIAMVAAVVIFAVRGAMLRRKFTIYLATLGSVFLGTVLAALAVRLGWSGTPTVALVASVLFLVPGAPLITGGFDITRNHNSVGLARIAYTVAVIATIALGLGMAIPLLVELSRLATFHVPLTPLRIVEDTIWGAVTGGALAVLNNGYWRSIGICALGGALARCVRETGGFLGMEAVSATLLAAVGTTLLVYWLGEARRLPTAQLAVMGCLTLIPGFFAISGVNGLFQLAIQGGAMPWPDAAEALQHFVQAVFISLAIVAGIIFTLMVVDLDRRRI